MACLQEKKEQKQKVCFLLCPIAMEINNDNILLYSSWQTALAAESLTLYL